eukprot:TRINITY_DN10017_c0_g1_i1.p1 TRINITY_DN10017_c0_g1~~TRINITY_DN10017_c0_g1_i1.p1  ORF type:complete len:155 (+),score=79.18 TRINITY_DN10017_c0_g1_i1:40-465(+)
MCIRDRFDLEEKTKSTERGQFYLEQCIAAKSREITGLQKVSEELQKVADKSGLGDQIDKNQAMIEEKEASLEAIEQEIEAVKQVIKRHKFLSNKYENIQKQLDKKTLDPNQLVDVLQTQSQQLKDEIGLSLIHISEPTRPY